MLTNLARQLPLMKPMALMANESARLIAASNFSKRCHPNANPNVLSGKISTPAPNRIPEIKFWGLYLFLMLNIHIVCLSASTRIEITSHAHPLSKTHGRRRNANEHYLMVRRSRTEILRVIGKRDRPISTLPVSRHTS